MLFGVYFFFVELGLGLGRSSVNVSGSVDKAVVSAMQQVQRDYRVRTLISNCGVHLWLRPRLSISGGEIVFYMDYYLTGLDNVKSEYDANRLQVEFEKEMNYYADRILKKASARVSEARTNREYEIRILGGNNIKP